MNSACIGLTEGLFILRCPSHHLSTQPKALLSSNPTVRQYVMRSLSESPRQHQDLDWRQRLPKSTGIMLGSVLQVSTLRFNYGPKAFGMQLPYLNP